MKSGFGLVGWLVGCCRVGSLRFSRLVTQLPTLRLCAKWSNFDLAVGGFSVLVCPWCV
jgi:hypothetical protein